LVASVAVFCITIGFSGGVEAAGVAASAVRTLRRWRDFLVDGVRVTAALIGFREVEC
jgi:hypothetical protein